MSVENTPKKAAPTDMHRADIIAALTKAGWSLAELSRQSGLKSGTLKTALDVPYLKAERIIAGAINLAPEAIWPSRYEKRNFKPSLKK